ncbi:TIGR03086 family metal-binding protein [Kribbella sp. CA-293567]|uniref:TIGR03086 family metal-binding protein n=1 Tax=Kribbella sp. CA-293567 TaxID=3002436 RepID=UPI0022DE6926|nr:TIGR03086 family metal-binding protein [Kribbella sp. CA-293567]WBQ02166.1 TIGR03086 family metal-binding protein [Kribbella sp. CA-293567]
MDPLEAAGAQLLRIVGSIPATDWEAPTPADLTIREVADHLVAGNVFAVRLLSGASAAVATADLDRDHLGDDPLGAIAGSCEEQRAAFATANRSAALHHPSGDISYETFLRFRLGDLVVHAWDLAVGAGLDPTLDTRLVDRLWVMVEPHLDEMRARGTFGTGASASLASDVPPQTRLLDAFGRRPPG